MDQGLGFDVCCPSCVAFRSTLHTINPYTLYPEPKPSTFNTGGDLARDFSGGYFGNVCELDLIFNFHKAYYILDEVLQTLHPKL